MRAMVLAFVGDSHWLFSHSKRLGNLLPTQKPLHQGWFQPQRAARDVKPGAKQGLPRA